jgi:regulator of cell morphogenesis and NO signaling
MNTLSAPLSVGEFAAANPAAVRILDRHQIDFCRGGKTPLDEACQAKGVDPAALMAEIERSARPQDSTDWMTAPILDLIEHIVSVHHVYLKAELPRLETILTKIERNHGGKYPAVPAMVPVFRALKEELDGHLMKEEMVLFPLIQTMVDAQLSGSRLPMSHCGSVRNPIRVMHMEHDSATGAMTRLRQLTDGYQVPAEACNTFRALYFELQELEADLERHIHLENDILFPRAAELEATF